MLSKAALRCLGEMIEAEADERYEDAELVCDGNSCWLGIRRVQKKTVNELLSVWRSMIQTMAPLSNDMSSMASGGHFMPIQISRSMSGKPCNKVAASPLWTGKFSLLDFFSQRMTAQAIEPPRTSRRTVRYLAKILPNRNIRLTPLKL